MDRDLVAAELSKPLDKRNVKPPAKFGPKGDYIEGWFAISEANRIFGWDGWSEDIVSLECISERPRKIGKEQKEGFGVSYLCRVRVTVAGLTKEDVGTGHGYDVDCGLAHESASKEAVTDALKRALRKFGNPFGLALYDKERRGVCEGPSPAQEAIQAIGECTTKDELLQFWGNLNQTHRHIAAMQDVIEAKDLKKQQLDAAA